MSKISIVYDQIVATLEAMFPNKTRLFDSFNIENNPAMILRDGWGIRVGNSVPEANEFCSFATGRDFVIALSKEMPIIVDQTERRDVINKTLLEEVYQIQKDFLNVDQLTQAPSIELIRQGGTSQIEEAVIDNGNFIFIEINFTFVIKEAL